MATLLDEFDPNADEDLEMEAALGRKRSLEEDKGNADQQGLDLDEPELKGGASGGADEPALKMKERKQRIQLNEAVLTNRDGLIRVYQDFPDSCKFRGKGHEAQDAKKIMNKFKEWGFQLFPSLAFPDLVNTCERLGSKAPVRAYMENMRERERCRYLNEVLDVPLSDILMPNNPRESPAKSVHTSPEAGSPSPTPVRTTSSRIIDDDDSEEEEEGLPARRPLAASVSAASASVSVPASSSAAASSSEMEIDDAMFLAMAAEGEQYLQAQSQAASSAEVAVLETVEAEVAVVETVETALVGNNNDNEEAQEGEDEEGETQTQTNMAEEGEGDAEAGDEVDTQGDMQQVSQSQGEELTQEQGQSDEVDDEEATL